MSYSSVRRVLLGACVSLLMLAVRVQGANMILNGSFENNSATKTEFNLTNSDFKRLVSDATAFGDAQEIDLMTTDAEGLLYGPTPRDGKWKLAIHSQVPRRIDAFSFGLSRSIVAGKSYALSCWSIVVQGNSPGFGPLEIGISDSSNSFGTLLYSLYPLDNQAWAEFSGQFVAPVDGSFLTVRMVTNTHSWAHLDDFSLVEVPAPSALATLAIPAALIMRRRR